MTRLRPITGYNSGSRAGAVLKDDAILSEITILHSNSHTDLKQRWQEIFSIAAPHNLSKRLLVLALAYELQVQAYGGLKKASKQMLAGAIAVVRRADALQNSPLTTKTCNSSQDVDAASSLLPNQQSTSTADGSSAVMHPPQLPTRLSPPVITLSPGTRLMREWRGVVHVVDVMEGGFIWNGKVHRSLSAIARAITGVRWNGLAFFGLRKRKEGLANRSDSISTDAITDNASQPHEQTHNRNLNNHPSDGPPHTTGAPSATSHQPSLIADPAQ